MRTYKIKYYQDKKLSLEMIELLEYVIITTFLSELFFNKTVSIASIIGLILGLINLVSPMQNLNKYLMYVEKSLPTKHKFSNSIIQNLSYHNFNPATSNTQKNFLFSQNFANKNLCSLINEKIKDPNIFENIHLNVPGIEINNDQKEIIKKLTSSFKNSEDSKELARRLSESPSPLEKKSKSPLRSESYTKIKNPKFETENPLDLDKNYEIKKMATNF